MPRPSWLRTTPTNATGNSNTASGVNALFSNTTGHHNTATGAGSLVGNSTGSKNTAIGVAALNQSTGNKNIGIGFQAGGTVGKQAIAVLAPVFAPAVAQDPDAAPVRVLDGVVPADERDDVVRLRVVALGRVVDAAPVAGEATMSGSWNHACTAMQSMVPISKNGSVPR